MNKIANYVVYQNFPSITMSDRIKPIIYLITAIVLAVLLYKLGQILCSSYARTRSYTTSTDPTITPIHLEPSNKEGRSSIATTGPALDESMKAAEKTASFMDAAFSADQVFESYFDEPESAVLKRTFTKENADEPIEQIVQKAQKKGLFPVIPESEKQLIIASYAEWKKAAEERLAKRMAEEDFEKQETGSLDVIQDDVRKLQAYPQNKGAAVQIASRFSALEGCMKYLNFPWKENAVTNHANDTTQGGLATVCTLPAVTYRLYECPPMNLLEDTVDVDPKPQAEKLRWWEAHARALRAKNLTKEELLRVKNKVKLAYHKNILVTHEYAESQGKKKYYKAVNDPEQRVNHILTAALDFPSTRNEHGIDETPLAKTLMKASFLGTLYAAFANGADQEQVTVDFTPVGAAFFKNPIEWVKEIFEQDVIPEIKRFKINAFLVVFSKEEKEVLASLATA